MPEEKAYIGCKIIKAYPMSQRCFEESRGNTIVTQEDLEGYKVIYPDGYQSWSPKSVFEAAYREISEDEKKIISE